MSAQTRTLLAGGVGAALAIWTGVTVPFDGEVHALILALLGGIYVGFGVSDGRPGWAVLECSVGAAFLVAAFHATTASFVFIGVAYWLHGVWDFLHHPRAVRTRVAGWYPPLCAVYDGIIGSAFLIQGL